MSEQKLKVLAEDQLKEEKKAIADSITNTSTTLNNMQSVGVGQSQALRGAILDISSRLDGKLQNLIENLLQFTSDTETKSVQT